MILEQSFIALPEILLGNHYSTQDYEAGIVNVLGMAILQELNGRNANNPIQHLQAERRYDPASPRRADLYVNIKRLMITNRRLGNYGWRHHNWVEAKFYRNKSKVQRHATKKAAYQGQMIADLIRLTCLVPLDLVGNRDSNGRYFLHVYDDVPKYYLPYEDRPWVETLHLAGRQNVVIDQLASESATAKAQFGVGLQGLQIQATVTNLVNYPITTEKDETYYWCVLTRFDALSVTLGQHSFQIHDNRVTWQNQAGDYAHIASVVGNQLGVVKPSEK